MHLTTEESVTDCIGHTPMVRLKQLFRDAPFEVLAKLEMLNPGGSVKDRAARFFVEQGLAQGSITPDTRLIESSSGNLGIALAMVARTHGLAFTCVVDANIAQANLKILACMGADIEMVTEPHPVGGYLEARINRVKALLATTPGAHWINQHANELNWLGHYQGIGAEIERQAPGQIDAAVIAVSTTGTALGVARRLRQRWPSLRLIAVDAVGSAIFGPSQGVRDLPGAGSSRVPEILAVDEVDEVVYVSDYQAALGCRALLSQEGIFAGASSGSVVAALEELAESIPAGSRVVTVFPDRGERYLDLVYDDAWVDRHRPVAAVSGAGQA